ncbi:MAG TPA: hypothetical protein VFR23_13805 [Jiangellaceae bacterium]|nr:hypothetical protein [Jiangellaceae bacterium]
MVRPRPLDKFVWVQHTSGKQKVIPRAQLPELTAGWERIYDPAKKPDAAETSDADSAPPAKKAAKKPSTAAESAPEKE